MVSYDIRVHSLSSQSYIMFVITITYQASDGIVILLSLLECAKSPSKVIFGTS